MVTNDLMSEQKGHLNFRNRMKKWRKGLLVAPAADICMAPSPGARHQWAGSRNLAGDLKIQLHKASTWERMGHFGVGCMGAWRKLFVERAWMTSCTWSEIYQLHFSPLCFIGLCRAELDRSVRQKAFITLYQTNACVSCYSEASLWWGNVFSN